MSASTAGVVLCGITLGARDWSESSATPNSSNRRLNLLPVFREMPYSRQRSVRRSPVASLLMNSLRRSMGDFVFQGTGAPPAPGLAGRHPCAWSVPSPMYLVCTLTRRRQWPGVVPIADDLPLASEGAIDSERQSNRQPVHAPAGPARLIALDDEMPVVLLDREVNHPEAIERRPGDRLSECSEYARRAKRR